MPFLNINELETIRLLPVCRLCCVGGCAGAGSSGSATADRGHSTAALKVKRKEKKGRTFFVPCKNPRTLMNAVFGVFNWWGEA